MDILRVRNSMMRSILLMMSIAYVNKPRSRIYVFLEHDWKLNRFTGSLTGRKDGTGRGIDFHAHLLTKFW